MTPMKKWKNEEPKPNWCESCRHDYDGTCRRFARCHPREGQPPTQYSPGHRGRPAQ